MSKRQHFSSSENTMDKHLVESWVPKNWCFWTVVLEKTLESPLDSKEIQPVHPKGNQFWICNGRTDVEAETLILWPPDVKNWLTEMTLMLGKIEGGRRRGRWRMRWLDGITDSMDVSLGKTLGVGDGQGGLVCCSPWGRKELDMTERLNWTESRKKTDKDGWHLSQWQLFSKRKHLPFSTHQTDFRASYSLNHTEIKYGCWPAEWSD